MTRITLTAARSKAFIAQEGRCFYCGGLMWLDNLDQFATKLAISYRQAAALQCTAEHLLPRSDGGRDCARNIVAACKYCNMQRHRRKRVRSAEEHQKFVRRRILVGRWLGLRKSLTSR